MFYATDGDHGLPHNPFKALVTPRPIGWITTLSPDGVVNCAPYSFFNAVGSDPPMVMYASNGSKAGSPKDTLTNVEATGEFVVNIATEALCKQVIQTSAPEPAGVDELAKAGLTPGPSRLVKPPRIGDSPINLECALFEVMELPSNTPGERMALVVGRVLGVHIDDGVLKDGVVDPSRFRPLARMGYRDYTTVERVFTP